MDLGCSSNCYSRWMFNRFLHLVLLLLSVMVSSYSRLIIKQKKGYFSCCVARHQKGSPINQINQQSKIIHPPKHPYRVYNVSENERNSHVNNVHKAHSLNKTNNHTSRIAPMPTSPPLNNVKPDTPTSVTQSYMFGNRYVLKIDKP